MVRSVICVFLLLLVVEARAQFATASLSRKKVVVRQPVKVKVTAYSPTWFAEPLSFKNLQVNGAFIQSFSRTVSGIRYVNNKKYATLEFYYILFPYQESEIIFPELEIATSIPPEGDYKGIPVILTTKPITIQVDPIPESADKDHWLVADNATINNRWSSDLNKVKVGDVISRTITIKAVGTLPSFIDEPEIGKIAFASVYTSEPTFFDDRDDEKANGRRVDVYSYLFEEKGNFTFPEVVISWYNPHAGEYYSRKLPEYKITVSENPEMNSLRLLKDSLNALNRPLEVEEAEEAESINYITMVKWVAVLLVAILIISWLWNYIKHLTEKLKKRRRAFKDSEAYWFNRALKERDSKSFLNALYQWLDRSGSESKVLKTVFYKNPSAFHEIDNLEKKYFSERHTGDSNTSRITSFLKTWRKKDGNGRRKSSENLLMELNP